MRWNKSKKIHIATGLEYVQQLSKAIERASFLAVDTETDGLKRFRKPVGISIAWSEDEALYIPLRIYNREKGLFCPWSPDAYKKLKGIIERWLTKNKNLLLHNSVFDIITIENEFGIDITPQVYCDTMFLAHTAYNEEGPLGLKDLAAELLDKNASSPQEDVKTSVHANGGKTTKTQFDMWMCDFNILGKYACYDVMYTYGIFNRLFPTLKEQELEALWNDEVMALLPVTVDLNRHGIRIDVPYFEQLKKHMEENIKSLTYKIRSFCRDGIKEYEKIKLVEEVVPTPRNAAGKYLIEKGYAAIISNINEEGKTVKTLAIASYKKAVELLINWYKENKGELFNLDSGIDKAYLLYNIMGLECPKETATGRQSTDSGTIEKLLCNELGIHSDELVSLSNDFINTKCEKRGEKAVVLKTLLDRSAEQKLLNTYVIPILECHVDGIIYTGFNQTGTTSGRYSSSQPINLQTLPRDDKRIKKGFIPREGKVFVSSDFAQLEPRCFSVVSNEPVLQQVFIDGEEDFYSRIAIDMFGLTDCSANPKDKNYLKKLHPELRDLAKVIALAIPYGAGRNRMADILKKDREEAQAIIDTYLNRYVNLAEWMEESNKEAIKNGYVRNLVGRKRRANLVNQIYKKYKVSDVSFKSLQRLIEYNYWVCGFNDVKELYYACRNNLNNLRNFVIQSLAAAMTNASCIDFYNEMRALGAIIVLQCHDEIAVECDKSIANLVRDRLQYHMEKNRVAKLIKVPMKSDPIITEKSIAEAKL